MTTDKTSGHKLPSKISNFDNAEFEGYTLDDLRYRRAVVALQKEFAREKMLSQVGKLQKNSPFSKEYVPARGGALGKAGAIAGKVINGLNYLDYAVLGYSAFSTVRKVAGVFGKFRKKH